MGDHLLAEQKQVGKSSWWRGAVEDVNGKALTQCLAQTNDLNLATPPESILNTQVSLENRPSFAHVRLGLNGSTVVANGGSLLWMDSNVKLDTNCHGGCGDAFGRSCSWNTVCLNTYTGNGEIGLSHKDLPSDILPFGVSPNNAWIMASGVFVAGTPNIRVSGKFPGCCASLCTGESFFFTHVSCENGNGLFFAQTYGEIHRIEIPDGESIYMNNGMFFAASESTKFELALPGGLTSFCCSGEGVVFKFYGPAVVYARSRDPKVMRKLLNPQVNAPDLDSGSDETPAANIA